MPRVAWKPSNLTLLCVGTNLRYQCALGHLAREFIVLLRNLHILGTVPNGTLSLLCVGSECVNLCIFVHSHTCAYYNICIDVVIDHVKLPEAASV